MKKHILLAEDAEPTRVAYVAILERAGYEVTAVEDGRKALSAMMLAQKGPKKVDLLITDIKMDGLDGLQLVDQLKKLQIHVPVMAITGYGDKTLVIELMRRGCNDYIEKPFESVELLKAVANLLRNVSTSVNS